MFLTDSVLLYTGSITGYTIACVQYNTAILT